MLTPIGAVAPVFAEPDEARERERGKSLNRGKSMAASVFRRTSSRAELEPGEIQEYCLSRFDRELDEEEVKLVGTMMSRMKPPVANRDDPRFEKVFEIIDVSKSLAEPQPEPEPEAK